VRLDRDLEAEAQRPVRLQVVAGPRSEPATEDSHEPRTRMQSRDPIPLPLLDQGTSDHEFGLVGQGFHPIEPWIRLVSTYGRKYAVAYLPCIPLLEGTATSRRSVGTKRSRHKPIEAARRLRWSSRWPSASCMRSKGNAEAAGPCRGVERASSAIAATRIWLRQLPTTPAPR
jgi:hypothetical protein